MVDNKGNKHNIGNWIKISIAVLVFLIVFSFFASVSHRLVVFKSGFLAEILPRVLVDLTNNNRQVNRVGLLELNSTLEKVAQLKADDMASRGYFAHNSPDGLTPWYWFGQVGYDFLYAGENLAVHFSDSGDVVRAWMDSPGHRANILNNKFSEIGIATSRGFYQGRETVFVVQMFGHPKSQRLITPPVLALADSEGSENIVLEPSSEVQSAVVEEKPLEIFTEERVGQSFVAVQSPEVGDAEIGEEVINSEQIVRSELSADYSKTWEKLLSSPTLILTVIYIVLGAIVFFLVILALLIEIHKHHWKHVVYGLLLLALILTLYLAYKFSLNSVEVLSLLS